MRTLPRHFNHKGLSLIELMVVIAIIGLTLSIGIPIYTSNVNKVNVSQMVNKLGTFKLGMVDSYTSTGAWPTTINGANSGATVNDDNFSNAVNFRYNTSNNLAWWGYQLTDTYGSGWIFMLLVANPDGTFITHCGSLSTSCTFGSCNSIEYFPTGCDETDLSDTFSLGDT